MNPVNLWITQHMDLTQNVSLELLKDYSMDLKERNITCKVCFAKFTPNILYNIILRAYTQRRSWQGAGCGANQSVGGLDAKKPEAVGEGRGGGW